MSRPVMVEGIDGVVPADSVPVIRSAMSAALGSVPISSIDPVAGGASGATPFRVLVGDRPYLVRLEGRASPLRNPYQYESMRIAAGAGIAPPLHHVDETARVAIMDFIEEQPLSTFPGGPGALAKDLAGLLGRVRRTEPFPRFIDYPEMVGRLWAWVCRTGLFAPGVLDPYTTRLQAIRAAYRWDPADSVSSHNDPVPRNVLYDGSRLWLIDWESAYRNDPLVDMAIVLDSFSFSFEHERLVLEAYSNENPRDPFHERMASVRGLVRLYYAGVLLSASFEHFGTLADDKLHALTVPELKQAIRAGRLAAATPAMTHALGKMYLASFLHGVPPPPLDERLLHGC